MIETIVKLEQALATLAGSPKTYTRLVTEGRKIADLGERAEWLKDLVLYMSGSSTKFITRLDYIRKPVSPETFLCSPNYLNKKDEVYPAVLEAFIEMNSGRYDEAVLTGGIGSAKTTLALYSQAYQLYLLSCLRSPQSSFGLDSSSEIKIIFQSLRASTAKDVDFDRFYGLIKGSPYFKTVFPYNKSLTSTLKFPNRIEISPVSSGDTATIGQNVIGGIIDEINFMAVIQNSKQSADGGTYDQAVELYNSIARRRKSRFMQAGGGMAGLLCVVSSKRLPEEFTDKKMQEAKTNPRIFVYDKRVWDIKPYAFCGDTFKIFVGNEIRRPRILQETDIIPREDEHLIDNIPIEFRQEFEDDITKAVRDIAGHSTLATTPFLPNSQKVMVNFGKSQNIVKNEFTDFARSPCVLLPSRIVNPQFPRYAHIDLSVTGDSTGLVIGHVPMFTRVGSEGQERAPVVQIDLALEIKPPLGGEIEFSRIRNILYKLRELGLPIKWVSLDSYQSRDSLQILRQQGFTCGMLSMDTSIEPYMMLKQALYDGRVWMPQHERLQRELLALEMDYRKGKVDHNALNSKDISDALAGVTYGLSTQRQVWSMHGVPLSETYKSNVVKYKEALNQGSTQAEVA